MAYVDLSVRFLSMIIQSIALTENVRGTSESLPELFSSVNAISSSHYCLISRWDVAVMKLAVWYC